MHRMAARLLLFLLLASPMWGTPQLGGLGGLLKKKPKQAQPSEEEKKKAEEEKKKQGEQKQLFADDGATAKQKKDTTAMGFSGLNPDGTVETAVLNSSPTGEDEAAAAALAQSSVSAGELNQFLQEGSLKKKGGQ